MKDFREGFVEHRGRVRSHCVEYHPWRIKFRSNSVQSLCGRSHIETFWRNRIEEHRVVLSWKSNLQRNTIALIRDLDLLEYTFTARRQQSARDRYYIHTLPKIAFFFSSWHCDFFSLTSLSPSLFVLLTPIRFSIRFSLDRFLSHGFFFIFFSSLSWNFFCGRLLNGSLIPLGNWRFYQKRVWFGWWYIFCSWCYWENLIDIYIKSPNFEDLRFFLTAITSENYIYNRQLQHVNIMSVYIHHRPIILAWQYKLFN